MIVVAKLKAQEEKEATLEAALRDMVKKVASEDGTEAYTLHKSKQGSVACSCSTKNTKMPMR